MTTTGTGGTPPATTTGPAPAIAPGSGGLGVAVKKLTRSRVANAILGTTLLLGTGVTALGFGTGLFKLDKGEQAPTPVSEITHLPSEDLYHSTELRSPRDGSEHRRISVGGVDYGMAPEDYTQYEQLLRDINGDLREEYGRSRYLMHHSVRRPRTLDRPGLEHLMGAMNTSRETLSTGEEHITHDELEAMQDAYAELQGAIRAYKDANDSVLSIGDVLFAGRSYGSRRPGAPGARSALSYWIQGHGADRPASELLEEIEEQQYESRLPTESRD